MLSLPPAHFDRLLPRVREIPFNTFFAEAVLLGHVKGTVYVDRIDAPTAFLVGHRCGLSLLAGDPTDAGLRSWVRDYALNASGRRAHMEFVQPWPFEWAEVVEKVSGDRFVSGAEIAARAHDTVAVHGLTRGRVVGWKRYNFQFTPERFPADGLPPLPAGASVVRLGPEHIHTWKGAVAPHEFWDSEEEYGRRGVAFGVVQDGELAALAFAAFVQAPVLEIGIETQSAFRNRGLAKHACGALIRHCLTEGLEPIWACRGGNLGSQRTAESLGFVKTLEVPYLSLVTN